jgi:hypothetical protein
MGLRSINVAGELIGPELIKLTASGEIIERGRRVTVK